MHGDGPRVQPARRARNRLAGRMDQHEPAGGDRMDVEGEALQRAWLGRTFRRIADDEQLVGLTNDLGAERGKLGVGEIEHVVIAKLLSVEPARHGFGVEVDVSGERRGKRRRIHGCDLAEAGEGESKAPAKGVRHGEPACADHGKRAGMGQALLVAGERVGETPRKRHGDRFQDNWMPLGEGCELCLAQFEHDRVAQRRDGGGACRRRRSRSRRWASRSPPRRCGARRR